MQRSARYKRIYRIVMADHDELMSVIHHLAKLDTRH
jgi:hypothetical protein